MKNSFLKAKKELMENKNMLTQDIAEIEAKNSELVEKKIEKLDK